MKNGKGEHEEVNIKISDDLHQFKYSGSTLTEDARCEKEIKNKNYNDQGRL